LSKSNIDSEIFLLAWTWFLFKSLFYRLL